MMTAMIIISTITGIGLIISVVLQTSKAESFSAAMGGSDSSQYRKGSREERLSQLAKYLAIIWISSCALGAIMWYRGH